MQPQNITNELAGAAFVMAQALVDIHDGLHPAALAVDRQVFCSGSGIEPKDFAAPASRAHQPSVLCDQFTIIPF